MQPTVILRDGIKRCSRCNLDLTDKDYRYISKHLHRCANKINPYIYSDRPRGRPPEKERRRLLEEQNRD